MNKQLDVRKMLSLKRPDRFLDYAAPWVPKSPEELVEFMRNNPPEIIAGVYAISSLDQKAFEKAAEKTIGLETFKSLAELVWRLMSGEGFTDESWAELFKGLAVYGVVDAWFRWTGLVENKLRWRYLDAKPAELDPRHVLKWAGKALNGV